MFSEIELVEISESPENPSAVWIHIRLPSDEEREIQLREIASELSTEILLNYGYSILISASGHAETTSF
ncbi:MAG: hypothetical protein AABZ60_23550 [Planctomycetota bacterium]